MTKLEESSKVTSQKDSVFESNHFPSVYLFQIITSEKYV